MGSSIAFDRVEGRFLVIGIRRARPHDSQKIGAADRSWRTGDIGVSRFAVATCLGARLRSADVLNCIGDGAPICEKAILKSSRPRMWRFFPWRRSRRHLRRADGSTGRKRWPGSGRDAERQPASTDRSATLHIGVTTA